jgi:hypothetical protein
MNAKAGHTLQFESRILAFEHKRYRMILHISFKDKEKKTTKKNVLMYGKK